MNIDLSQTIFDMTPVTICGVMGLAHDDKARYEFCSLLKELNTNKQKWSHIYAYNVTMHMSHVFF